MKGRKRIQFLNFSHFPSLFNQFPHLLSTAIIITVLFSASWPISDPTSAAARRAHEEAMLSSKILGLIMKYSIKNLKDEKFSFKFLPLPGKTPGNGTDSAVLNLSH